MTGLLATAPWMLPDVSTETLVLALVAAALVWCIGLSLAAAATRPGAIAAAPATAELPDDTPPAVVALITQGWTVTEGGPQSTLVDLAARRYLEFRQPAGDPRQTTVHLTTKEPDPGELLGFELEVLDRIRVAARGGVAPVAGLRVRGGDDAGWRRRFEAGVRAEADVRGLTRSRYPGAVKFALFLGLGPAALILGLVATRFSEGPEFGSLFMAVAAISWLMAGGVALGKLEGQRATAVGRDTAGRWLALQAFMRGDEAFAQQPPAAVVVWGRYLAYGDALGVTSVVREVLDLGAADRRRVWSAYGGTWRVVRATYPRGGPAGRTRGECFRQALKRGFWVTALLLLTDYLARTGLDSLPDVTALPTMPGMRSTDLRTVPDPVIVLLGAVCLLLVLDVMTLLVGSLVNVVWAREVTGEVLWLSPWKRSRSEDEGATPVVHYLVVDEGTSDTTKAWALPHTMLHRCNPGDEVWLRVRPWSRRVDEVKVLMDRAAAKVAAHPVTASPATALQAADGSRILVSSGRVAAMQWEAAARSPGVRPLAGVGSEALVSDQLAVAREGDRVVLTTFTTPVTATDAETAQLLQEALDAR